MNSAAGAGLKKKKKNAQNADADALHKQTRICKMFKSSIFYNFKIYKIRD